ncbi:MAG TPA: AAA family ATPase [Actinomycetes bacterium]|nr:AAA family ATPase [Actinomycetes bacterium]
MNNVLRYWSKKTLKILLWVLVLYALAIPILYWLYKSNRGLDWWSILGGDPRVSPEFRGYLIQTGHPIAPPFDLWKVTRSLPFTIVSMLATIIMLMTFMIVQFAGLFWFLSRGRTYVIYPREYDVTFNDVRGQPEIVASTKEALSLFQGFKKFRDAGGYPPHGILFEGPPGTGKTLLGKAIAGSARVPFVYASGTSFSNMFLGVGNLRIAHLFRKARKMSKKYGGAVIFLDELDAVGGSRGAVSNAMSAEAPKPSILRYVMPGGMGMGGMLVNELLVQMDGMTMPKGLWRHVRRILHLGKPRIPQYNLMVIGATNQASTLDPALLRPGRFDRKLHVGLPTGEGREDILQYYLSRVPHEPVDIARLARATYGFSPAQIKNLVNEALIFALIDGRDKLNFTDLWTAKVTEEIGLKEVTQTSARDRQMTAFHEAGHAVLAYILELDDQIQIASIIKRRDTLGLVYRTPIEERHTHLREDMRRDIVVAFGGMAAEEIWFGESTGGPGHDLLNATARAAEMLGFYGMGDSLISYAAMGNNPMGGGPIQAVLGSPEARRAIGRLLQECKDDAVELLRRNEPAERALAERLLEKDEVPGEEIEELMRAKGVARATPAFKPALELLGENWHQPALVEALPAARKDPGPNGDAPPSLSDPEPDLSTGTAPRPRRPDDGPNVSHSTVPQEFEW